MPFLAILLASATIAAPAHAAPERTVPERCFLGVDGKTLVRGRCSVYFMSDGSFTLNTAENGKRVDHFAMVDVTGRDRGDATWNAESGDLHAWDKLGPVERKGACWVNARARICAWKLSASK